MAVVARILHLIQEINLGKQVTVHCSFNPKSGCEKVKFLLSEVLHVSGCLAAISMLNHVRTACETAEAHVTDRGHRHTNGVSEVCFYIRWRTKTSFAAEPVAQQESTAVPMQPSSTVGDKLQADIESLCAILDSNIEREIRTLSEMKVEFAAHAEELEHVASQSSPDLLERTNDIKQMISKCNDCFHAQQARIQQLREIRSRAARGVLSTDQCVQEMQAMRDPLAELADVWSPTWIHSLSPARSQ